MNSFFLLYRLLLVSFLFGPAAIAAMEQKSFTFKLLSQNNPHLTESNSNSSPQIPLGSDLPDDLFGGKDDVQENQETDFSKARLVFSQEGDSAIFEELLQRIDSIPKGGKVSFKSLILTNTKGRRTIFESLKSALRRGVTVIGSLANHIEVNKSAAQELNGLGAQIELLQHEHQKVFTFTDPVTKKIEEWIGSSNMSNAAFFHNLELMVVYPKEQESPTKQTINSLPKNVAQTPQKGRKINSSNHDLLSTLVQRIDNSEKNDEVRVATMTINEPVITALMKLVERGGKACLVIDKSGLIPKTDALLREAAVKGVDVKVDCNRQTQHIKLLCREKGNGEKLAIISTGNATENSSKENNAMILNTDPRLCDESKAIFSKIAQKATPIGEVKISTSKKRKFKEIETTDIN